ncbi:GPR1/FUN34/YaaH family transporter [Sciscionella sediminilitoris]|uniref:GPR1/FUN34/YaaH family transporter n=1 Tax=Sciscionella sediminilitoris TaxID=1445613 RepID=UPI0004DF133B|nr:GPR1/FUN34/YaaH family transporter [Sciscionella sp. SE31]
MTTSETKTRGAENQQPESASPAAADGDPALIGVPTFVVGSVALGLVLVGYVSAEAVGASVAIILAATGLGQIVAAAWAARLAQNAVASIFGTFAGFWLSYGMLVLGLGNHWYGIPEGESVRTQGLFLIAWLSLIIILTIATLRLPRIFTLLFVLVSLALALVLAGTLAGSSTLLAAGGIVVFGFALVGVYLFLNATSLATGGSGLPLGRPLNHN